MKKSFLLLLLLVFSNPGLTEVIVDTTNTLSPEHKNLVESYLPDFIFEVNYNLEYIIKNKFKVLIPKFFGESKYSIPVAFDFDGDLDSANNKDSIVSMNYRYIKPVIYTDIFETKTHYYIGYFLNYPLDNQLAYHENDNAFFYIVVDKEMESKYPLRNNIVAFETMGHCDREDADGLRSKDELTLFDKNDKRLVIVVTSNALDTGSTCLFSEYKNKNQLNFYFLVKIDNINPRIELEDFRSPGINLLYARIDTIYDTLWRYRSLPTLFYNFVNVEDISEDLAPSGMTGPIGKQFISAHKIEELPKGWNYFPRQYYTSFIDKKLNYRGPWAPWAKGHGWMAGHKNAGWYFNPAKNMQKDLIKLTGTSEDDISLEYIYNPYLNIF